MSPVIFASHHMSALDTFMLPGILFSFKGAAFVVNGAEARRSPSNLTAQEVQPREARAQGVGPSQPPSQPIDKQEDRP